MANGDSSTTHLDAYFPTEEDSAEETANGYADHDDHEARNRADSRTRRGGFTLGKYVILFSLLLVLAISFIALQIYLPLASKCGYEGSMGYKWAYNHSGTGARERLPDGRWSHNFLVVSYSTHS